MRTIIFIWDFDLTLSAEYQQLPIFRKHFTKIKAQAKKEGLALRKPEDALQRFDLMRGAFGVSYLQRILWDAQKGGCLEGLSNEELRTLGSQIAPARGLVAGWWELAKRFAGRAEIKHHIVTVGLRPMVEGFFAHHKLLPLIDGIDASEFFGKKTITGIKQVVLPFSKNEWIFSYMKGGYSHLNELMREGQRKYHFKDSIVIGDGFTDIAKFSVAKQRGGVPCCVYDPENGEAFEKAKRLLGQRVDYVLPRDYTPGRQTFEALATIIERKLARRCQFTPVVLFYYRDGEVHPKIAKLVKAHLGTCRECRQYFEKHFVAPGGKEEISPGIN